MNNLDDLKLRILNTVPLEQLVSELTPAKKQGGRLFALCPFHEEKSPSFTVFEGRRFYCFGCKASGDVIDLVRRSRGIGFVEALKVLAERFQIEAPELEQSAEQKSRFSQLAAYHHMMQIAAKHFESNLRHPSGQLARSYLQDRGIESATINTFGLGLAKDSFQDLADVLKRQNFSTFDGIKLSLLKSKDPTGPSAYDFFRNRTMVPIHDPSGRVIAFGGRDLGDRGPKYLNSAETPLYAKRQHLFAYHLAVTTIRKSKRVIVTEGYMDTIQLWQQGFQDSVACLGTALTYEQVKLLSSQAQFLYLVFDGDSAGRKAITDTLDLALAFPTMQFRAVVLPKGDDPDSLLRKPNGKAAFEHCLQAAIPLFDFVLSEQMRGLEHGGIPGLLETSVMHWLLKVQDPIRKAYLLAKVADYSGVPVKAVEDGLLQLKQSMTAPTRLTRTGLDTAPSNRAPIRTSLDRLGYEFLAHLYFTQSTPEILEDLRVLFEKRLLSDARLEALAQDFLTLLQAGTPAFEQPFSRIPASTDGEILELLQEFQSKKAAFLANSPGNPFSVLRRRSEHKTYVQTIDMLKRHLHQMDREADSSLILREILSLTNKMKELDMAN